MPKIIIIHGPMGSGKSTISSKLIEKLPDYVLVDKAYIKDIMLKKAKKKNPKLVYELSNDITFLIAKKLLDNDFNIIIQEVRAPKVRKKLGDKYKIISFYLHCSVEEAKKRDLIRQKKFVRPEVIEEMHEKHAYPDKEDIEIDTKKNSITKTVNLILNNI